MLFKPCSLCSRLGEHPSRPVCAFGIDHIKQTVRQVTRRTDMSNAVRRTFFLDEFAEKQFNDTKADYSGTRIYFDPEKFVATVQQVHDEGKDLVGGYAPFCKHIFVPNFTGAKLGSLNITQHNKHLLQTGYSRRRPEELPVLSRHACAAQAFLQSHAGTVV